MALAFSTSPVESVIEIDDFRDVPLLQFLPSTDGVSSLLESIDFWEKNVGISPQEFYDTLTDGLPPNTIVQLFEQGNGTAALFISNKKFGLGDGRQIYFQKGFISDGNMEVDSSNQGQGIGSQLVLNYIKLGLAIGLKSFSVHASNLNGSYTWARFGVYMDLKQRDTVEGIRKILFARLQNLEGMLPLSAKARANVYARLSNPDDVCNIADLNFDLFSLPDIWDVVSDDAYPQPLRSFFRNCTKAQQYEEQARITSAAKYCKDKKIPFTLGRYLLAGIDWHGDINFDDPKQLQRIQKYLDDKGVKVKLAEPKSVYA